MAIKSLLVFIFLLLSNIKIFSQKDSMVDNKRYIFYKDVSIKWLIGINQLGNGSDSAASYPKYWLAEIGIHKTKTFAGHHGPTTLTYGASTLINLGKDKLYGFRVGAWTSYLLAVGVSMTYYTDFKKGNLKITPEFGFGIGGFKLAAGYNISTIGNKDFSIIEPANVVITINALIKLKTIYRQKW